MALRPVLALVLAAGLLAALASAGRAADAPPAKPILTAPRTVTPADLPEILRDAGLSCREEGGRWRLDLSLDNTNYFFYASVSANGRYLWLTAPLERWGGEHPLDTDRAVQLLTTNAGDGGYHFLLRGGVLQLARAVDNRALRADMVAREVRGLVSAVRASAALWAHPEPGAPAAPAMEGG